MSKIVFTNGTFDLLHAGHFSLLQYCKKLAGKKGKLIIGLDSDEKITQDKGLHRPIFSEAERIDALMFLCNDVNCEVFVFKSNSELYKLIEWRKPDVIVKGDDWKDNIVGSDLAKVKLFPRVELFSSTKIINRVVQKTLQNVLKKEIEE